MSGVYPIHVSLRTSKKHTTYILAKSCNDFESKAVAVGARMQRCGSSDGTNVENPLLYDFDGCLE